MKKNVELFVVVKRKRKSDTNLLMDLSKNIKNMIAAYLGYWLSVRLHVSLSFRSPVSLICTPEIINFLYCWWICPTTGKFSINIKDPSIMITHNMCCRLCLLLTALWMMPIFQPPWPNNLSQERIYYKMHKGQFFFTGSCM